MGALAVPSWSSKGSLLREATSSSQTEYGLKVKAAAFKS